MQISGLGSHFLISWQLLICKWCRNCQVKSCVRKVTQSHFLHLTFILALFVTKLLLRLTNHLLRDFQKTLFQMDPGSDRPHHSSHSHHTSHTSHSHHTSKRGCRSKKCSRYLKRIESPSTNCWRNPNPSIHLYFRGVKHHNPNCRKLSSSSSALHDDMTASSHVSSHVSPSHQVRVGTCDTCQWYDDSDRTVLYPSQPSLMIA